MYTCENCEDGPCKTDRGPLNNHKCKPVWQHTDKFQITETPEPVYVLDIQYPVDERYIDAAHLLNKDNQNGLKINFGSCDKHKSEDDNFAWIKLKSGGQVSVPKSWIKQKPAEPTREELQGRLDRISHLCMFKVPKDMVNPEYYDFHSIANGEKQPS